MDVKQAVAIAKIHITDLYATEGIHNLGLEEVEFDSRDAQWLVTLGFSRSWDAQGALAQVTGIPRTRSYKCVRVDAETGQVISVTSQKILG